MTYSIDLEFNRLPDIGRDCHSIVEEAGFRNSGLDSAGEKIKGEGFHPESWSPAPSSLKREADDEDRSAVAGLNTDRALVVLNDLFRNVEAQTGAPVTFSGEKWFENLCQITRRDSSSRIGNDDPELCVLDACGDR